MLALGTNPTPERYQNKTIILIIHSRLPEFHGRHTTPILNVPQFQLLKFLTLGMEINAADRATTLVETDVVKAFETCPRDCFHAMVGNEKVLLPTHEKMLALVEAVHVSRAGRGRFERGFGERAPGGEACPVLHVDLFGRAPRRMVCAEEVFGADDFAFEKCC